MVHLELFVHLSLDGPDVSLPVGLPRTLERITVELRQRLQGYKMAHISLPNHPELRDWPEALITAEGNEGLRAVRLEVWQIWDGAGGSKHDEPGWWKKIWRVEGADVRWRMDTSSEQGLSPDIMKCKRGTISNADVFKSPVFVLFFFLKMNVYVAYQFRVKIRL